MIKNTNALIDKLSVIEIAKMLHKAAKIPPTACNQNENCKYQNLIITIFYKNYFLLI